MRIITRESVSIKTIRKAHDDGTLICDPTIDDYSHHKIIIHRKLLTNFFHILNCNRRSSGKPVTKYASRIFRSLVRAFEKCFLKARFTSRPLTIIESANTMTVRVYTRTYVPYVFVYNSCDREAQHRHEQLKCLSFL